MSLYDDIKVIAFRDVTQNTPEYRLNYIYRWYSKTYHTALHEVYSIPFHDIVKVFFEERFEGMTEEEREETRRELLMTEEEREAAERISEKEEVVMESVMKQALEKVKEVEKYIPPPPKPLVPEQDMQSLPENIKIEFVDDGFIDKLDMDEPIGLFDKK